MNLSNKAIQDLRNTLIKKCEADVIDTLSDEEINEIGELLLITLSEGLKQKVATSN